MENGSGGLDLASSGPLVQFGVEPRAARPLALEAGQEILPHGLAGGAH